jgi:hypothetical protein
LQEWVDAMFRDEKSSKYFAGTAIHWYESTYDYFPDALQYAHNFKPKPVSIRKFHIGMTTLGIGKKKPLIGDGIGLAKKTNTYILNMLQ